MAVHYIGQTCARDQGTANSQDVEVAYQAADAAPASTEFQAMSAAASGGAASSAAGAGPAATAAPVAATPPPALAPPDLSAATLVPIDEDVQEMSIWRKLGQLATSEPGVDPALVVVGGDKPLLGMSLDAISIACGPLVQSYDPVLGQPDYGTALEAGRAIEAGTGTADAAAAFRRSLAREAVAKCLVYLALSAGLLKRGGGYVFLPSMIDVAQAKAMPPPVAPVRPPALDASVQEEVSKQVAIQLAAVAGTKGGGAAASVAGGKGAAGAAAGTEDDPDRAGLTKLLTRHANTEVCARG
eukprot:g15530.t1